MISTVLCAQTLCRDVIQHANVVKLVECALGHHLWMEVSRDAGDFVCLIHRIQCMQNDGRKDTYLSVGWPNGMCHYFEMLANTIAFATFGCETGFSDSFRYENRRGVTGFTVAEMNTIGADVITY